MLCKKHEDYINEYLEFRRSLLEYRQNGTVFIDKDFRPFENIEEPKVKLKKEDIELRRIDEVYKGPLFDEKLINSDCAVQGRLGDCYFIAAMMKLASYPKIVIKMFVKEANVILGAVANSINIKCGGVAICLYSHGKRTPVVVDTYLPFYKGTSKLVFCRPSDLKYSICFCLIEKAYAKLNGSYSNIASGNFCNAMYALTGYFPTSILISKLLNDTEQRPSQQLIDYMEKGCLMDCSIHLSETTMSKNEIEDAGLIKNHSYSIIDIIPYNGNVFFKLKNPWCHGEWNKDWSDNSCLWNDKMRKDLKMEIADDGVFIMIEQDFFKYFTSLCVSKPIPENWHSKSIYIDLCPDENDGYEYKKVNARIDKKPNYVIKLCEKVPDDEEVVFEILTERKAYFLDEVKIIDDKISQIQFICALSNGNRLTNEVLMSSYKTIYTISKSINGFEYKLNDKNESFTIAIQRIEKRDFNEHCSIQIFCKYNFILYEINNPENLVEENTNYQSIFDDAISLHARKLTKIPDLQLNSEEQEKIIDGIFATERELKDKEMELTKEKEELLKKAHELTEKINELQNDLKTINENDNIESKNNLLNEAETELLICFKKIEEKELEIDKINIDIYSILNCRRKQMISRASSNDTNDDFEKQNRNYMKENTEVWGVLTKESFQPITDKKILSVLNEENQRKQQIKEVPNQQDTTKNKKPNLNMMLSKYVRKIVRLNVNKNKK